MKPALLVTPVLPWNGSFGAAQRTSLLYNALQRHMPVEVLQVEGAHAFEALPGDRDGLLARLKYKSTGIAGLSLRPDKRLRGWAAKHLDWNRYSVVVGRYPAPALKLGVPTSVPLWIDADDAVRRSARKTLDAALTNMKSALRTRILQSALSRAQIVFFTSEAERRRYNGLCGKVLPNVPFVFRPDPIAPAPENKSTLLFVGALWYGPNKEGVEWFLKQCWPILKQRFAELRLRLIGACPPAQRAQWEAYPDVESPGFVDDLAVEYDRALFAVAPIREGAGTNIKVLEAYAYGRPCVITQFSYAAFADSFKAGESIAVARDAEEMVERCAELYRSADARARMAAAGREVLARDFSQQRFDRIIDETMQKVMQA